MIIEWLKFKVPPELHPVYLQKDAEIWTKGLSQYPGFVNKQVWLNPEAPDEIIMVIGWESQTSWQAIPEADLALIEQHFREAMGGQSFELLEAKIYPIQSVFNPVK